MTDHAPPPDTAITVSQADAPPLRLADPQDVLHAVAFALRFQRRRRIDRAGEMMAWIAPSGLPNTLPAPASS